MIRLTPQGLILAWKTRRDSKRWGILQGGYLTASLRGVRVLQRIHEWGTASLGEQKELIARFELEAKPVKTVGLLHLELFNPAEARLFMLSVKVWRGWDLFLTVNLGPRYTKDAMAVRAKKMTELMLQKSRAEQAERFRVRRATAQIQKQRSGRPWPARAR